MTQVDTILPDGGGMDDALETLLRLASVAGPSGDTPSVRAAQRLGVTLDGGTRDARLRLAEARYRVLIEQIPAVTFMASLADDANEIYVSPQIESLLGFTQEEWVSDPVLWFHQVHPDDREWLSRDFASACVTGEPFHGVIRVFTRAGVMRWVQAEARFVRDDDGSLLFLQGAGFDVSEQFLAQEAREQLLGEQAARAEAERDRQRLHELFATVPAAIVVLSSPGFGVEFMNPVAMELAVPGVTIGMGWSEAFPQFGMDALDALRYLTANGGVQTLRAHRTPAHKGQGERFFNVVFQTLPGPGGQGDRLLVYAADITNEVQARRSVEDAVRLRDEALEQLRGTLKTREQFLSAAAHDLKTPVATIKGFAQLLARRIDRMDFSEKTPLIDGVAAIQRTAVRMGAMVEEFLDIARLHSGQPLLLDRRQVDLVKLAHRVVAEQQGQTDRHQIRVIEPEEEVTGRWDPIRLERVLGNLLENAIKYSPGGGDVFVRVRRVTGPPGRAEVEVSDPGIGIPEADLPRVFEQFYRGSNVMPHLTGTGIGLSGALQLIRAHGGVIDVASRPGEGSTFTIRLPLGQE